MNGERVIILRQTTITETRVTLRDWNTDLPRRETRLTFRGLIKLIREGGPQVFGFFVGNPYSYANWSHMQLPTETIRQDQEYAIEGTDGTVSAFRAIDD